MNAFIAAWALLLGVIISLTIEGGALAVLCGIVFAGVAGAIIRTVDVERSFLIRLFAVGVLARVVVGAIINGFKLQEFFGGDAFTYDIIGDALTRSWGGESTYMLLIDELVNNGATGWGMFYLVGAIYSVVGRNMLAVQFFNAVVGAATAPVIFLCAHHIFGSLRVSRIAALFVAFYPSLILWSSQGLKDGPIVFLLALIMLATLKLGERLQTKYFIVLALSLAGLISLRFYIFYMATAAVVGAFLIGMRPLTSQSLARQLVVVVGIGLILTYFGVLRRASAQLEVINLQMVQNSRSDLATSAQSGFAKDIDVSTTSGALTAIPVGMVYLLFAPFPWQLANLRQSITLPEMLVWWGSFPLLVLGAWFTVKFRLRQALPILIFTSMLTIAYSIFQGNVGTAYRQRSQILVFYFIFVAVGAVLLREQQEDKRQEAIAERRAVAEESARKTEARKRFHSWKRNQERELEEIARGISERIDF